MSRLPEKGPEKGEAKAAAEALDARLRAVAGERIAVAEVNGRTGEIRGEGSAVRGAYGDLFDIAEVAVVAEGPIQAFIEDIAFGTAPDAALRSMFLMAVAHGVLMERGRWQR